MVLRPFNNFGPRQNDKSYAGIIPIVITRAMANRPITIFGDGAQTRDFVFVEDTARAALLLAERDGVAGKVFNVGSGRETSVNDLVGLILGVMRRGDLPVEHGPARAGDVRRHCAGIERATRELGFRASSWAPRGHGKDS